jgi:hypothetical protein
MTDKNESTNENGESEEDTQVKPTVLHSNIRFTWRVLGYFIFIALGEIGIILWQLSEKFLPEFPKTANVLLLVAVFCFGGIGVHNIIKSQGFQAEFLLYTRKVWAVYCLFCVGLSCVFFLAKAPTTQNPNNNLHLSLALNTSHSPKDILSLTNDFLYSQNSNSFPFGNVSTAYVVVPANSGETNILLQFFLLNDSDETVDTVEVLSSLPSDAKFLSSAAWAKNILSPKADWATNLTLPQTTPAEPFQQLSCVLPGTILPKATETLPSLIFNTQLANNEVWGVRIPVSFRIRAKNVQQFCVGFWLVFPTGGTNTVGIRPKIISPARAKYGTNGDALLEYP